MTRCDALSNVPAMFLFLQLNIFLVFSRITDFSVSFVLDVVLRSRSGDETKSSSCALCMQVCFGRWMNHAGLKIPSVDSFAQSSHRHTMYMGNAYFDQGGRICVPSSLGTPQPYDNCTV